MLKAFLSHASADKPLVELVQRKLTNANVWYDAVDIEIENTDTIEDLIDAIIKANKNLTTSNESNDWEMMGKDVKKIQELIDKLEILTEEEKKNEQEEKVNNEAVENVISNSI